MLTCVPQGICAWNYRICDGPVIATLEPDFVRGQASLVYGNCTYEVTNDDPMGGHWNIVLDGKRIAQATQFGGRFDVFDDDLRFTLTPSSMITREFEIALPSGVVGTIAPEHPFTRRAILECDYIVPVPLQLFSFCLVVFAWRKGTEVEIEAG